MGFTQASAAIDGSKLRAVNNRDKNFTCAQMERRLAQIKESARAICTNSTAPNWQEPQRNAKSRGGLDGFLFCLSGASPR
jgi:hypothetical protein